MVAAAEMGTEVFQVQGPVIDKKLLFFHGVGTTNSDFFTITALTAIEGAYVHATDGTLGTFTFATNVLTVTNAAGKTWYGLAWGT